MTFEIGVSAANLAMTSPKDFAASLQASLEALVPANETSEVTVQITEASQVIIDTGELDLNDVTVRQQLVNDSKAAICSPLHSLCKVELIVTRRRRARSMDLQQLRRQLGASNTPVASLSVEQEYIHGSGNASVDLGSTLRSALSSSGVNVSSVTRTSLSARSTVQARGSIASSPVRSSLSAAALTTELTTRFPNLDLAVSQPIIYTPPPPPTPPPSPPPPSTPPSPPSPPPSPLANSPSSLPPLEPAGSEPEMSMLIIIAVAVAVVALSLPVVVCYLKSKGKQVHVVKQLEPCTMSSSSSNGLSESVLAAEEEASRGQVRRLYPTTTIRRKPEPLTSEHPVMASGVEGWRTSNPIAGNEQAGAASDSAQGRHEQPLSCGKGVLSSLSSILGSESSEEEEAEWTQSTVLSSHQAQPSPKSTQYVLQRPQSSSRLLVRSSTADPLPGEFKGARQPPQLSTEEPAVAPRWLLKMAVDKARGDAQVDAANRMAAVIQSAMELPPPESSAPTPPPQALQRDVSEIRLNMLKRASAASSAADLLRQTSSAPGDSIPPALQAPRRPPPPPPPCKQPPNSCASVGLSSPPVPSTPSRQQSNSCTEQSSTLRP